VPKTDLEIALQARRTKQIELLPKVKIFLDSITRNSIKSKLFLWLKSLLKFSNEKEQQNRYSDYNCETILQSLLENKIMSTLS
jgi:hypothetical protein